MGHPVGGGDGCGVVAAAASKRVRPRAIRQWDVLRALREQAVKGKAASAQVLMKLGYLRPKPQRRRQVSPQDEAGRFLLELVERVLDGDGDGGGK